MIGRSGGSWCSSPASTNRRAGPAATELLTTTSSSVSIAPVVQIAPDQSSPTTQNVSLWRGDVTVELPACAKDQTAQFLLIPTLFLSEWEILSVPPKFALPDWFSFPQPPPPPPVNRRMRLTG
ncbi:unnamed protein product [Phytophthora fragariaefolia]|uniref:Unnamed protein product n=1 Tax=Phytophthora fragariaefolia TaxID=1490495 RepID=A0A9W6XLQ0_9STRA|nr:unnamed protein product [Phytophthora fragariaefolia]